MSSIAARMEPEGSNPKTTRPEAPSRRHEADSEAIEQALGRRVLDAFPDRIDCEDWEYRPTLNALPHQLVSIGQVPYVLDQGTEGACTGFALAAVINFLLARVGATRCVSPRMLYEMARRYDEWPGEAYEGSSARGAMKGWQRHGVCDRESWPDRLRGPRHLSEDLAQEARQVPGGAYYRVDFRQVRHVHAALNEVGAVYATLMVHAGWGEFPARGPVETIVTDDGQAWKLPVIARKGRADACHAVALVGYTARGFVVQNSWGKEWGRDGFALLPYEDFMMHATDVWVAQLGVPITADLWEKGAAADVLSGRHRAGEAIPLSDIRPYVINIGNNGILSDSGDYWTTEDDLDRLFSATIPEQTRHWSKRRIMLYLHGGLNNEKAVAQRIVAFRDVCLRNEIYPLHIMWESDWFRSAVGMLEDLFSKQDERAGNTLKHWGREARDRVLELTLARPGSALWGEMKENARLASVGEAGAMRMVAEAVRQATAKLADDERHNWELHVVAHSAGSIFAAHAAEVLSTMAVPWKTTQFMAPAITVDEYVALMAPRIQAGHCPPPLMYLLGEQGELDDDVGPYGKSLLYLVSNAFEAKRGTPLLGMLKFLNRIADPAQHFGLSGLVVSGAEHALLSRSETHGGFDNDKDTMNSVMRVILGQAPQFRFSERDLDF
jgi:hypothetical protein